MDSNSGSSKDTNYSPLAETRAAGARTLRTRAEPAGRRGRWDWSTRGPASRVWMTLVASVTVLFGAALAGRSEELIVPSPLVSFDWVDQPTGFGYYSDLCTDDGLMGGGAGHLHGSNIAVSNQVGRYGGQLRVYARQDIGGTSWEGRWVSVNGIAARPAITANVTDYYPPEVVPAYRVKSTHVRVRLKGVGRWKIEFKDSNNALVIPAVYFSTSSTNFTDVLYPLPVALNRQIKFVNLVVESRSGSGSDLWFDSIEFLCAVPSAMANDPLRYAFAVSFARFLQAMNADGTVRDRVCWPASDFDSVPSIGMLAYSVVAAYDLGVISKDSAVALVRKLLSALLLVPRHPGSGLLPHWLKNGQRHPNSEWSSVDTALGLVPMAIALKALGLTTEYNQFHASLVAPIDFSKFTTANNELSHGFDTNGNPIPYTWTEWNSELVVLLLLRALQDPKWVDLHIVVNDELYAGQGFLYEVAGLFSRRFGVQPGARDRFGRDWHEWRRRHLDGGPNGFTPNQRSLFPGQPIFGLDPVEIYACWNARTIYCPGGVGTNVPSTSAHFTETGFGERPWAAPHYCVGFVADLDPEGTSDRIIQLRNAGLFPPLGGVGEAIQMNEDGSVAQWHRTQITLNLFFLCGGLYRGINVRDGRRGLLYTTVETDAALNAAVSSVFGAGGQPDLVVTGLVATPVSPTAGQPVTYKVVVRNQGDAAAGPFNVDFWTHLAGEPGPATPQDSRAAVAALAAGASATLTFTNNAPTTGTAWTAWAYVDHNPSQVAEWEESNNTRACDYGAPPDLVVTALSVTPANPIRGAAITFTATIRNQGGVAAGPFNVDFFRNRLYAPIQTSLQDARAVVASLPARGSKTVTVTSVAPAYGTAWNAWVYADHRPSQVAESVETNNTRRLSYTPPRDLVVTTFTVTPAHPAPGAAVTFRTKVKNQGLGLAGPFNVDFFRNSAAAPEQATAHDARVSVASLAAGGSRWLTVRSTAPATGSAWTGWVYADHAPDQVTESNELNNTRSWSYAPLADLVVTALSVTPPSPTPGAAITYTATVKNQGLGLAGPFNVDFFKSRTLAPTQTSLQDARATVPLLDAGASTTVTANSAAPTTGTTWRAWVYADHRPGQVTETSESNNVKSAAYAVGAGITPAVAGASDATGGDDASPPKEPGAKECSGF